MAEFEVSVTIENRPGVGDPEGTTILKDLVLKGTYKSVSDIRTAKMLKFVIAEETAQSAEERVREICDELRVYNPLVSTVTVRAVGV